MKKIITLSALILVSGCETISNITVREDVQPWQKAALAEPAMQFPQDEMQAFADEHIYFSKEASSGGNGVGGGGCGCN
jgi:Tfp pilus assembly protein PilP